MIDLLVAGGGPAGLATAIDAAKAGLSVTVVEPRTPPVDKACGEGLMPTAVERLRELGVTVRGRPFRGIRYLDPGHCAEATFRHGYGLGVRRTDLQAALVRRAIELGVSLVPGRVAELRADDDGIRAAGPGVGGAGHGICAAGLWARYLVAADGLHSPIRRQLGLSASAPGPARYGLRRHFRIAPWSEFVEVHWGQFAEAYVTPVGPDLMGVAILTGVRGGFDAQLAAFPALRSRLAGAPPATDVRGAGPLRQRVRARVAGRVLLVGDAAGYVDALTGEGISVSLSAAAALVDCVRAGRPDAYDRAWRRLSRECRALTAGLLWARRQRGLGSRIVPLAAALPSVFSAMVSRLA